jgi:hypothetical protein
VRRSLTALAIVLAVGCDGELQARERADGGPHADAASSDSGAHPGDAATDAASTPDAAVAPDAFVPPDTGPPDCSASASGTSPIWTCTSDHAARQRCTGGFTETDVCAFGPCVSMPTGVDDVCPSDPTLSNASTYCPGGACVHWWNCHVTYQYQYTGSGDWDTDFHMPDGTPIALPHRSQLTAVYLVGSGFQPEFADLETGNWVHFNHLHLNSEFGGDDHALGPVQLVSLTDPDHPDHVYPAGWVVGFSGGGTTRTGYLGTDAAGNVCSGGHSTAAHFCAVTRSTHTINYYLPDDGAGCSAPLGWPSALWSMIAPGAPGYQTCPSVCTGCGVAHF